MDFYLAKDIKTEQIVLIGDYNFVKLTEDNLFGCYYGSYMYFDKESAKYESNRFAKYGCNIWEDSVLRRRISKGGSIYDRVISEELAWNLEEVVIETSAGKEHTKSTDVFFIPSVKDMNEEWVEIAERLMPRWKNSKIWLRDRRGETQTAYWDKDGKNVRWTHPNTPKSVFLLCKIKPNTMFEKQIGYMHIGRMIATEENMPGINYSKLESFLK